MPLRTCLVIFLFNFFICFAGNSLEADDVSPNKKLEKISQDSSVVIIPFEYKQSALYHSFTLSVMDSVITVLLKDTSVKLSIEGYTHVDEGSDTICYYLSLNRALFIKDYVLGRGVDSSRIIAVKGFGKSKPLYHGANKEGIIRNCRLN